MLTAKKRQINGFYSDVYPFNNRYQYDGTNYFTD